MKPATIRNVAAGILLAVLGVVTVLTRTSSQLEDNTALDRVLGTPKDAFVVDHWLVLVDSVSWRRSRSRTMTGASASGYRVSTVDLATGKLVARLIKNDTIGCWPASALQIWCEIGSRIDKLELPMYSPVATTADEQRAALARKPQPATCRLADHASSGSANLRFGEGSPAPLLPTDLKFAGRTNKVPPHFVDVGDPSLVVIEHGDPTGYLQLSRVDADLHVAWTVWTGGECAQTALANGALVVATTDPDYRVTAIDVATGKIRWRFAYPGLGARNRHVDGSDDLLNPGSGSDSGSDAGADVGSDLGSDFGSGSD